MKAELNPIMYPCATGSEGASGSGEFDIPADLESRVIALVLSDPQANGHMRVSRVINELWPVIEVSDQQRHAVKLALMKCAQIIYKPVTKNRGHASISLADAGLLASNSGQIRSSHDHPPRHKNVVGSTASPDASSTERSSEVRQPLAKQIASVAMKPVRERSLAPTKPFKEGMLEALPTNNRAPLADNEIEVEGIRYKITQDNGKQVRLETPNGHVMTIDRDSPLAELYGL